MSQEQFDWRQYITEEFVTKLVTKEMHEQMRIFEMEGWELKDLDFHTDGNYTFIAAHFDLKQKRKVHRYFICALSGTTKIWEDSNVIDSKFWKATWEVQERVTNYFNHVAGKLNELKPIDKQ